MPIKYDKIIYVDNDNIIKSQKIDKVFQLAIVQECYGTLKDYRGINIGISIPHNNETEEKCFYDSIFGNTTFQKDGFIRVDLIGEKGERIPVMIAEANGWAKDMGTSCLFGYISGDWLAGDEHPTKTNFGSVSKDLQYKDN